MIFSSLCRFVPFINFQFSIQLPILILILIFTFTFMFHIHLNTIIIMQSTFHHHSILFIPNSNSVQFSSVQSVYLFPFIVIHFCSFPFFSCCYCLINKFGTRTFVVSFSCFYSSSSSTGTKNCFSFLSFSSTLYAIRVSVTVTIWGCVVYYIAISSLYLPDFELELEPMLCVCEIEHMRME